jgi:hypothetical protein
VFLTNNGKDSREKVKSYMWMSCNSESSFYSVKYPVLCALKYIRIVW